MDSLVVWISLYHEQRDELNRYGVVHPCSEKKRFHLSVYLSDQKHLANHLVDSVEGKYWGFFTVQVPDFCEESTMVPLRGSARVSTGGMGRCGRRNVTTKGAYCIDFSSESCNG